MPRVLTFAQRLVFLFLILVPVGALPTLRFLMPPYLSILSVWGGLLYSLVLFWWIVRQGKRLRQLLGDQAKLRSDLRENAWRLYSLIDHLPQGALLTDERNIVRNVNEPFAKMFGFQSPAGVVGMKAIHLQEHMGDQTDDPRAFAELIDQLISEREPGREHEIQLKDRRIIVLSYTPVQLHGAQLGNHWLFEDVTEARQVAQALADERALLASANLRLQRSWETAQELAAVATSIADGDLSTRATVSGESALEALARALNQMAEGLEARNREREETHRRVMAERFSVRRRVAEQLHGSVQSKLLVIGYWLTKAQKLVSTDAEQAAGDLQRVAEQLEQVRENEIRALSHELFPAILQLGLLPMLRFIRDQFEGPFEVQIELDPSISPEFGAGAPEHEESLFSLYRAVEELLSNALKHAQCSQVRIHVQRKENLLILTVSDDGVGYTPTAPASGGIGTASLRDLAEARGGALQIVSRPGEGTTTTLRLPSPI